MTNFGEKLRFWIENNFGSIQNFADLIKLNYATLHHYITNRREPNLKFLNQLKVLGCDINWLLSDSPDPPPETNQLLQARLKELEEENARLRDSIGRFILLAQKEVEAQKRGKQKPKK